jgi:small-conductance mechanosensitive channel
MTFLDQFTFPSLQNLGPTALAAATILATVWLARAGRSRSAAPALVRRRLGLPKGVVRWLVISALSFAALLAIGIDLQGLWSTVMAAFSLIAIGFVAMWSILSHMLASVLIVIFRPFEVGDRVELLGDDEVIGEVTDLNPVYTTLRAADGGTLQVPNNVFFQKSLKRHVPSTPANGGAATAQPALELDLRPSTTN